ncbi:MAG: hypothetical protein J0I17_04895 ['Candidatus Kapabacteria' thiocyanatum]|nr:hypothetical protein ['Candidatus Kapabacteria' thiocyanatum]
MTVSILLTALMLAAPQQQPSRLTLPSFKAPPGYTTKVTTKTTRYNFSNLRRDILLPLDKLPLTGSEIPKGVSMSKVFSADDKTVTGLYNDPSSVVPGLGKPSKKLSQVYTGDKGGTVVMLEFSETLPQDIRTRLNTLFYKQAAIANTEKEKVEYLANDRQLIIWCFKTTDAPVKLASQQKTFEMVNTTAEQMVRDGRIKLDKPAGK